MPSMWPVPCSVQRRCRPSSSTRSTGPSTRPHSTSRSASTRWDASWKSRYLAPGFTAAMPASGRRVHGVVDLLLQLAVAAVDRQRAGDVRGVVGVRLHARVEQQQVAGADRAVVAHPVQGAGVRAGGADRAVADVVALHARAEEEGALDVALAGRLGLVEDLHDVLEAAHGGVDGLLQLADLELVLDQAGLGEEDAQFLVALGGDLVGQGPPRRRRRSRARRAPGRWPRAGCRPARARRRRGCRSASPPR